MKRDMLILLFIITLIFPACANAFYKVIDLGTLGGNRSFPISINNIGQVVGWAENASGLRRATLFDSTGNKNNIDLGALGGMYSTACSINDNGHIVGWAQNSLPAWRGTLFDPSGRGNNIDLGTIGGESSIAVSINNR